MHHSDMRLLMELRSCLEGFAARHAAMRVAEGHNPQALLDTFAQLQQAADANDYASFAQADRALHEAIISLAAVPALAQSWKSAFAAQDRFRLRTTYELWPDLQVLFENHRPLVDAIAAGDPLLAEESATTHLDAVWYRLEARQQTANEGSNPLHRACAFLAFNFHERVRLSDIARDVAGCSVGHLARLFQERHGLSFVEYVAELRLQKAADLLQRTRLEIGRIGERVGYANLSRFAAHFRRRFGQSPREFRRQFSSQVRELP